MYFANKESKIYIMHAVGVYIMPPLAVVQKTVFAKLYGTFMRYVALQHDMFHFVQHDIYSLCSYSI